MRKIIHPKKDKTEWHKWFVWFPVKVYNDNTHYRVWWEYVERKGELLGGTWYYMYRFPEIGD